MSYANLLKNSDKLVKLRNTQQNATQRFVSFSKSVPELHPEISRNAYVANLPAGQYLNQRKL